MKELRNVSWRWFSYSCPKKRLFVIPLRKVHLRRSSSTVQMPCSTEWILSSVESPGQVSGNPKVDTCSCRTSCFQKLQEEQTRVSFLLQSLSVTPRYAKTGIARIETGKGAIGRPGSKGTRCYTVSHLSKSKPTCFST